MCRNRSRAVFAPTQSLDYQISTSCLACSSSRDSGGPPAAVRKPRKMAIFATFAAVDIPVETEKGFACQSSRKNHCFCTDLQQIGSKPPKYNTLRAHVVYGRRSSSSGVNLFPIIGFAQIMHRFAAVGFDDRVAQKSTLAGIISEIARKTQAPASTFDQLRAMFPDTALPQFREPSSWKRFSMELLLNRKGTSR